MLFFAERSDFLESQKSASIAACPSLQSSNMSSESTDSTISPSSAFVSLVHKVFGGKLQTTYQCSNCKSISLHKEGFTDLHLAFPEISTPEIPSNSQKNSSNTEDTKTPPPPQTLTMQKLIEKIIGKCHIHYNYTIYKLPVHTAVSSHLEQFRLYLLRDEYLKTKSGKMAPPLCWRALPRLRWCRN